MPIGTVESMNSTLPSTLADVCERFIFAAAHDASYSTSIGHTSILSYLIALCKAYVVSTTLSKYRRRLRSRTEESFSYVL